MYIYMCINAYPVEILFSFPLSPSRQISEGLALATPPHSAKVALAYAHHFWKAPFYLQYP